MNNPLRLVIDAVLVIAVAVLFYLHFASKPAAAPAAPTRKVAISTDSTSQATTALEAVADTDKVAYVESEKLLEGYQAMKDARKSFEAKVKKWSAQNDAIGRQFQSAVQKYQQTAGALTQEQRAATEQQLEMQRIKGGQEQQKLQQQAAEEEARMTKQVLDRVDKQVEAYGKANGYRLILISAPGGAIAYGRKDIDITKEVLADLNAAYKKK
ncbi:OmpH family outer membrane protein [Hymenobacter sp. J193]|uniref:OmpH family outer membrane protein n=1 Tax=Hymenobacter sp. J193 TaxID=2898429 RepID=UPI002151EAC9|nr:OmpH family outer membrane protein [Hymenobacter sp. J193]MCR5887208.1 OmpH family outer membrane protein [Hymenobacter sp. J193]